MWCCCVSQRTPSKSEETATAGAGDTEHVGSATAAYAARVAPTEEAGKNSGVAVPPAAGSVDEFGRAFLETPAFSAPAKKSDIDFVSSTWAPPPDAFAGSEPIAKPTEPIPAPTATTAPATASPWDPWGPSGSSAPAPVATPQPAKPKVPLVFVFVRCVGDMCAMMNI